MKRRFKQFIKTINKRRKYSYAQLTKDFNTWATQSIKFKDVNILNKKKPKYGVENPRVVYLSKAFTNKHVVRKWCEEFNIKAHA